MIMFDVYCFRVTVVASYDEYWVAEQSPVVTDLSAPDLAIKQIEPVSNLHQN